MRRWSLGVAAVGVAILSWFARPFQWDGLLDASDARIIWSVPTLALVFGTVAGALSGALDYRRVRAGRESPGSPALIALLAASFIALWPIAIFVSRPGGDPSSYTYGTSRLVEVCAAWLLYAACAYVIHKALTARARRRGAMKQTITERP